MKKSRNNIILIAYIKYIKYILSLFIFISIIIKTGTTNKFKVFKLSNNYCYIVKQDGIYYSNIEYNINKLLFVFNETKLTEEDIEMASFAEFKDNSKAHNLILIKDNIYALLNDNYICKKKIEIYYGYGIEYSLIYPYNCNDSHCNFGFVYTNSQNNTNLELYEKSLNNCDIGNPGYHDFNSNIGPYNINCDFPSNGEELITCFYHNKSEIKYTTLNLTLNGFDKLYDLVILKNIEAKFMKSILSPDETKYFICYINTDNDCDCLIYDINNNTFSDNATTYLSNCSSGLNIEYFNNSNEYILYCSQNKSIFNLIKLNENFESEDNINNIYDLTEEFVECNNSYLYLLIDNSDKIKLFANCDNNIKKYQVEKIINSSSSTSIINLMSLSSNITISSSIPKNTIYSTIQISKSTSFTSKSNIFSSYLVHNTTININKKEVIIIQQNSQKTKEEIKKNLKNIVKNCDVDKIYEIFGDDYKVKISPINYSNKYSLVNELSKVGILIFYLVKIN